MANDSGSIEIFDLQGLNKAGYGQIRVYVNLGYEPHPANYNPLPSSEFDNYEPDQGFIKNTGLRTPLFSGPFGSSPLQSEGIYNYITDSKEYTWLYNTFNYMAVTPFRRSLYPAGITQYSAALYGPAPAGSIQVVVNDKNQPQTFSAKDELNQPIDYYFATDPHGNSFILGSVDTAYANDVESAFQQAVLPKGWGKSIKTLESDLTIEPSYGDGNRRVYNQFRDNMTNNFFQISFAKNGQGFVRGIAGLPLSGGNGDEWIRGTSLSETIYGGRGNDRLTGEGGADQIWGDDGDDIIQPGIGKSQLWGGSGKDVFIIRTARATIEDFSKQDGDVIDLRGSFGGIPRLLQVGDDVKVMNRQTNILVKGADLSDLILGQNLLG